MRPILLCGLPGSGKSAVGTRLAARRAGAFVDLDELVAEEAGRSIADLFAREGEAAFRDREGRALRAALERAPAVIALGGGTLCRADHLQLARSRGTLVWLWADPAVIVARLESDERAVPGRRPLLAGGTIAARVRQLLDERWAFYDQAHVRVDTTSLSPDQVAERVERCVGTLALESTLPPGAPTPGPPCSVIQVPLGARSYEIVVGAGFDGLGAALVRAGVVPLRAKSVLVADEEAARHHGEAARAALAAARIEPRVLAVPSGEQHKRLSTLERLAEGCVAAGLDRGSVVFALGGGVVGDLAGLLAATLYRGVRVVQLPTTLLAQVDAAIGGKTAVDLEAGKNLLGAFHQPRLVFASVETLGTLPVRELRSGLGEVVKYSLLGAPGLLEDLEALELQQLSSRPADLVRLVVRCAEIKATVVAEDEEERGDRRKILNLGHTLGHALETESGYSLAHGEAVALGLLASLRVSRALGLEEDADLEGRVTRLLARLGLPTDLEARLTPAVLARVAADKKRVGPEVDFVCVRRRGAVEVIRVAVASLPALLDCKNVAAPENGVLR